MPPLEEKKQTRVMPVLAAYTRASLRYPWMLSVLFLSVLCMQAASVIVPLYLKRLVDLLSTSAPSPDVVHAAFLVLVVYAGLGLLNWLFRFVQRYSIQLIETKVMADLVNNAFSYLIRHSYDFFSSHFTGSLTRRVTRYSRSYEQVLDSIALNFAPTVVFAVGSITVLALRSIWLGAVMFVWIVLFMSVQIVMTRWRQPLRVKRAELDSQMTGVLSDSLGNQTAVAVFANETHEESLLARVVDAWREATRRSWSADNIQSAIQQALGIAIEVGLLGIGVVLWQRGIVTVGDFILIQIYIIGLLDQIWNIGYVLRRLYDSFADAYEMIAIFETPHEVHDAPTAVPYRYTRGEIQFDRVGFYFTKEHLVFDDFSLHIVGGEKVAFVGPSGAGKSTITKLLLRLYDPTSGTVLFDEQDISQVTQESLRKMIAFVPQEPVLFHRTLRENIAYGRQDASEDEIAAAAMKAHCHEFISALPFGYDTYVGERGVKLSGGERQRVAIARAILKNAPILILDEATSSLDSESELLIKDALEKLMEGKTVIAIAHRLSTVMKMDRIIVIEGGKVVLAGTHNELLAHESNLYKKLWEIQAGGFISGDEE